MYIEIESHEDRYREEREKEKRKEKYKPFSHLTIRPVLGHQAVPCNSAGSSALHPMSFEE